ncbi:MAG TPA: energy transducer TonB [Parvularculaceae bacterium]|nr:energy transducer TonB [Parvularculaceae bacterium]
MGSFARLIFGLPGAALVTVALFLAMAYLIKQDPRLAKDTGDISINITAQLKDTDIANANKDFKRPTLDTPPPPPPAVNDPSNRPALDGVKAAIPQIDANLKVGAGFNPDRDAQPLVRIPPEYPDNCKTTAKDEETVVVQFDVTPDGQTANIKVIESSNHCLDRAAMRSVERWKYQPKIVDNKAEWRHGVTQPISFRLTSDKQ